MKQQKRYGTTLTMEPPKHNDDFEKGIIKFCLSPVGGLLPFVLKRLKPEYFYNDTYRDCFRAICDMVNGTYGVRVDPDEITFAQYAYDNDGRYNTFRQMSERENVKGLQTFQLFAFDICSSEFKYTNLEYAVSEIIEMYKRRRRYELAIQLQNMTGEWFDNDETARKIYDQLAELGTLDNEVYNDIYTPLTYSAISSALQHQGTGLCTGYIMGKEQNGRIVKREFKIPPKQITVIAAATGHGKTTFCYNLALRLIRENERPDGNPLKVVYLSYEEPAHNIAPKIINAMAGVNLADDNRQAIADDLAKNGDGAFIDNDRLRDIYTTAVNEFLSMEKAETLKVRYCDYDASKLCGVIRDLRRHDAADVVIIDYVQLIEKESSKAHGRNRADELKEICADLRRVATDEKFGLPVIVASQFNRKVQESNDPRTMDKTNIGESANIEHVANVILGLWNCGETKPESYTKDDGTLTADGEKLKKFLHTKRIDDPFIYARLLKSRDGVNGLNMTLNYYGNCGRIDNTTDETPNQRAGYDRDENTEPHNALTPAFTNKTAAPAAEPADGGESVEPQSGKDILPF